MYIGLRILQYVSSPGSYSPFIFDWVRPVGVVCTLITLLAGCGFKANNVEQLKLLASKAASSSPTLAFTSAPAAGSYLKGGSSYTVSWNVENATAIQSLTLSYAGNGVDFSILSSDLKASDTSYSWSVPSNNVSTAVLKLTAKDILGNSISTSSLIFGIDSTAPDLTWTPPASGGSYAGNSTFSLVYSASDSTSGIGSLILQYSADGINFDNGVTVTSSPYSWKVPSQNTSSAKVKFTATDQAGNQTTLTSSVFTLDSVVPVAPSVSLVSVTPTNSRTASFTVSSCTDFAGIYGSESSTPPSASASGWSSCSTSAGGTTYTMTIGDGTKNIYFYSKDTAGNVSSASTPISISLQQTPPGAPAVTLTSGTPTTSTSSTYTIASCAGIAGIYISESNTPPTAGAAGWTACSTTASATIHTLSAGEAVKNVYFYAKDSLGNVSSTTVITVTLDQTAPGAPSVSLASTNPFNSTAATFTVASCTDRTSIYASSSTTTPTAGAAGWQTCSQSAGAIAFTVAAGDGAKSVYFWAKDGAANISATYATVAFTLDTTLPALAITSPAAGSYIYNSNKAAYSISGSCSENGRTVTVKATDSSSAYVTGTQTCNTGAGTNWSVSLDVSSLTDGAVTLSATQTDTAGNTGSATTVGVTKDTVNPTVAFTSPANNSYVNNVDKAAVTISGSCTENGTNVNIDATDSSLNTVSGSNTCNTGSTPNWSVTLNFTTLVDGAVTVSASQTDTAGNTHSPTLELTKDIVAPANATSLGWGQSSPSISVSVLASWTLSAATDLGSQTIQFYSDGTCTTPSAAPVTAGIASTQSLTGSSGQWTYKVTSIDSAGNTNTSGCSSVMVIREASLANSLVSVSPASIQKGQTSTVTLTIRDSTGAQNTVGGYTVSFSASTGSGVSTGTFSSVTDNNDGTYTATFTGTAKGTATSIGASITSFGTVTSAAPTITVTNTAPTLAVITNKVLPVDTGSPLTQGTTFTLSLSGSDVDSDSLTYSCVYQSLDLHASDPNYAAASTNCTSLHSLVSTNSTWVKGTVSISGSTFTWTPTYTQRGTFQLTFKANDGVVDSSTQSVILTVKANDTTTNLLSYLDALFSTNASGLGASVPSAPNTTSAAAGSWLNLISIAANGTSSFTSGTPWSGTGQSSSSSVDPYALNFTHTNSDSLSLSTVLNGSTQFGLETWVKPSAVDSTAAGRVIASNGGGDGNGFVLRQSTTPAGRAEFVIGKKYYSYRDLVLSDKPVGYWRLGELAGTTAYDLSAYGKNGTYTGGYTLNQTGIISNDTNKSLLLDGTSGRVNIPSTNLGSAFTFEAWFYLDPTGTNVQTLITNAGGLLGAWLMVNSSGTSDGKLILQTYDGTTFRSVSSAASAVSTGAWHYAAATVDRTTGNCVIYLDGVNLGSGDVGTTFTTTATLAIGSNTSGTWGYLKGKIDDVVIYPFVLTQTQITEHYQTGLNGNYKPYPGNTVLADNPIGYWRLNEKSGTTAYDLSGNSNHGTYNGNPTLGAAGPFDGSSSAVTMKSAANSVNLGAPTTLQPSSKFSFETWYKTSTASASQRFICWSSGTQGICFGLSASKLNSMISDTVPAWQQVNGTTTPTTGVWHHAVTSYDGANLKIYHDGVLEGTTAIATTISYSGASFLLGNSGGGSWLNGSMAETAFYDYPLSLSQITSHYNSGLGTPWWLCQSQSQLSLTQWNLLQTIYDGTTAQLFVNGQQECSVTPGTTYSGAVANTKIGNHTSGSSFWSGALAWLKIFGTNNGSAPTNSTNYKTDFDVTANRFRMNPLEHIVTDGLIFNFDAANARQGVGAFSNGCASTDFNFTDLSTSLYNGTLSGFQTCGASEGWVGNGTVANPYALAFNATNSNFAYAAASTAFNTADTTFTIAGWFNTTSSVNSGIVSKGGYAGNGGVAIMINSVAGRVSAIYKEPGANTPSLNSAAGIALNDGAWHHFGARFTTDTSSGAGMSISLYIDGSQSQSTSGTGFSNPYGGNISGSVIALGVRSGLNNPINYYTGKIAITQFYNRGLSAQEVKQNCLAQEGRFTATPQSICGAP